MKRRSGVKIARTPSQSRRLYAETKRSRDRAAWTAARRRCSSVEARHRSRLLAGVEQLATQVPAVADRRERGDDVLHRAAALGCVAAPAHVRHAVLAFDRQHLEPELHVRHDVVPRAEHVDHRLGAPQNFPAERAVIDLLVLLDVAGAEPVPVTSVARPAHARPEALVLRLRADLLEAREGGSLLALAEQLELRCVLVVEDGEDQKRQLELPAAGARWPRSGSRPTIARVPSPAARR